MKKRFRISHSLLSLWGQGLIQEAINTYLHINPSKDPKMAQGRALHEKWANDIKNTKTLVLGATTLRFDSPRCEYGSNGELNKPYNELWDVGGRFDCLDKKILYEFKSGVKTALDYAGEYQIPFYFLLAELAEIEIEKAILAQYNQYQNKTDLIIIWNGKEQIERVRNWIDSLAYDIYDYFRNNGLILNGLDK